MKKMLAGLLLLGATSTASADKVGAYLFGVQYTQDMANGTALRYGVGVPGLSLATGGGAISVSGDVSYLMPLRSGVSAPSNTNVYYGAQLGAGVVLAAAGGTAAGGVTLVPGVLVGAEYTFPNTAWSAFLEGSAGVGITVGGSAAGVGAGAYFAPGLRVGVNYRIR